jgi:hypothetical protein
MALTTAVAKQLDKLAVGGVVMRWSLRVPHGTKQSPPDQGEIASLRSR